ncbi:DNA-binding transcriptional regulator, FadR family [Anaerovirgula multivorans]|uniref:DNA-binding transcriptional regulator, FadR family n=1 Tax=Anaerovirgula multivorans TaxID=312168 RepID=A0A239JP38_9FIRM|nr:GntR family transcriptional regulator [Anaerovirgula multivorans]SNT07312.1 DNA-binding transcriptional regulator, FadR family [Anaerovirgula multivorans]
MADNKSLLNSSLANKSVVDRVVEQITGAIINGELKPGDKLPTEVELCESFQIGRNSVREAIKVLESFGVVYIKRSEGTYVSSSFNHRMLDPMLYGLILEKDSAESIIELRKVFDTGLMFVVIKKANEKDMHYLHKELEQLEIEVMCENASAKRVLDQDIRFHTAIVLSTHNELIQNIAKYIDRLTIPSRIRTMEKILKSDERIRFIELHRQIVDMIERKDISAINETVESHYMFWKQN